MINLDYYFEKTAPETLKEALSQVTQFVEVAKDVHEASEKLYRREMRLKDKYEALREEYQKLERENATLRNKLAGRLGQ